MKPKIKAEITIEKDLAGIVFKSGKRKIEWNELTKEQQINICNSFADFYKLFSKFIKE